MNLKMYFNLFLLGLCLTTVLVTLVTYIIFRIRYTVQGESEKGQVRLEGEFFKRFAPHIERMNQEKRDEKFQKGSKRLSFRYKMTYGFIGIFLIVSLALISENYFIFRDEINKRVSSAESFRSLLNKGMLKTFEFNPNYSQGNYLESINPVQKKQLQEKASRLLKNQYILFSNAENWDKTPEHKKSVELWKTFLKRYKLNYKIVTRIYNAPKNAVWILANYERILEKERVALLDRLKDGQGVFLTGLVGTYNLNRNKQQIEWFENNFKLKVEPKKKQQIRKTQFSSVGAPLWNIPPGLTLPWRSNRPELSFLNLETGAVAHEVDYIGTNIKTGKNKHVRHKIFETNNSEIIWSHHDPFTDRNKDEAVFQFYSDSIFLSSMEWITEDVIVKVENWKNGSPVSAVISVDAVEDFKNISNILSLSNKNNIPLTIFTTPEIFQDNLESLKELRSNTEIALSLSNSRNMTDSSIFEIFSRLQQSRIDIELFSAKPASGIRLSADRIDEKMLNSISQNRFKYIFGSQNPLRFAPLQINNTTLSIFPRLVADDFEISKTPLLATQKEVANKLIRDFTKVSNLGGAYLFGMHTQIFGKKEYYLEALSKLYLNIQANDVWLTTFDKMADWWKKKESILVKIGKELDGRTFIELENMAKSNINNIVLSIKRPTKLDSEITTVKISKLDPRKRKKIYLDSGD